MTATHRLNNLPWTSHLGRRRQRETGGDLQEFSSVDLLYADLIRSERDSRIRAGASGVSMATGVIHYTKIYSRTGVAVGASSTVTWKNPPEQTALSYWAYAHPPAASGQHGTTRGQVEITSIKHTYNRDNYNGDKQSTTITVKNTGTEVTGYDVYQSWVTAD